MNERIAAFLVWGLVGVSAGAYALKLWPHSKSIDAPVAAIDRAAPASLDRLLGAEAPVVTAAVGLPADARFQLLGVVAARDAAQQGHEGVAVLSWDGQPPRALRVGQMLDAEWQLLRVEPQGAQLGRGGVPQVQLKLEPPPTAVAGVLPPAPALAPAVTLPTPPVLNPAPGAVGPQRPPEGGPGVGPMRPPEALPAGTGGAPGVAPPADAERRKDPRARI